MQNKCSGNTCLTLVRTGDYVSKATVTLLGGHAGSSVWFQYYGGGLSAWYRKTCDGSCSHQFIVGRRYNAGTTVCGHAELGNVSQGQTCIKLP